MATTTTLPSLYQEFIALSRYSKFQSDLGRREKWGETVDRSRNWWKARYPEHAAVLDEIYDGVAELEQMPSMRSVMTAGPALDRDHMASYNCSASAITGYGPTLSLWDDKMPEYGFDTPISLKINRPVVFDELFYILLCGTGVGFSVERQFIAELPTVGRPLSRDMYKRTKVNYPGVDKHELSFFDKKQNTIYVADSKYGWASSLRILIVELYNGNFDVKWDVSAVRPAGAPLKTFGGRASGPQALEKMFENLIGLFQQANGRKLNSLEAHDAMCFIAEAVVVGGVRRAALLSLSNLSDERMRYAKSGEWWVTDPQRALSNNSVAYTEKPTTGTFMREWQSIYESKSGERGISNRESVKKACAATGRDPDHEWLFNPCFAPGTLVHTRAGHFPIEDLVGRTVEVWDGFGWVEVDNFRVTATDQEVSTVTLHDGTEITATPYHKFILADGTRKELKDLVVGDELAPSTAPETHGAVELKGAYLKGFALGDGTSRRGRPIVQVFDQKTVCADRLVASANQLEITNTHGNTIKDVDIVPGTPGSSVLRGLAARKESLIKWCGEYRQGLPAEAFAWTKASKVEFLAGLFDADGTAGVSSRSHKKDSFLYALSSVSKQLLLDVQVLLKSIGVKSKISVSRKSGVTDFGPARGGLCNTKTVYALCISQASSIVFASAVKFSRLRSFADETVTRAIKSKATKVVSIVPAGVEEKVYCCTVGTTHAFCLSSGVYVGNCHEIALRDSGQTCNLTSVMVRPDDTFESLARKARNAAILGTFQATLTDFVYVSPRWKKNCEEERLLGVSLTGTTDHPVLRETSEEAARWLRELAQIVRDANAEWASKLGINKAAAATAVKPEGTVSQLTDTASGLHDRFGMYYYRRVRADAKDPLAQVMRAQGFPCEVDVMQPSNLIFTFPVKSPDTATLRGAKTAVQQLEYWRMFKQNWCDSHNPSVTVYVKESEWPAVGAWIFGNFDDVCGVSFLPHSDHIYQQAPYEECTKEEYEAMLEKLPKFIDYEALGKLETTDLTTGMREFACVGGACEI